MTSPHKRSARPFDIHKDESASATSNVRHQ